jgi:hypothetical protein
MSPIAYVNVSIAAGAAASPLVVSTELMQLLNGEAVPAQVHCCRHDYPLLMLLFSACDPGVCFSRFAGKFVRCDQGV